MGQIDGAGARKSDTRTSRNAWLSRGSSIITNSLYKRAAHLLKVDEKLLYNTMNAEDLQVYEKGNN